MWEAIFGGAAGLGLLVVYKALKNRDGPTSPPGVAADTPMNQWPKDERRRAFDYQIAQSWKPYLAGGTLLAIVGLAGTVANLVRDLDNVDDLSRDELIEALAEDSTNTYDREEAACILDLFDSTGVDITAADSAEELQSDIVERIGDWSDAQLSEFDDCLDEESRQRGAARLSQLSDQEIRTLAVDLLMSSPDFPNDRGYVECAVGLLEKRQALRSLLAGEVSGDALEALTEAELDCR